MRNIKKPRLVEADRKVTVTQITMHYNSGMQKSISEHTTGTACSLVAKDNDRDPEGRWFKSWCSYDKIHTTVGPLRKKTHIAPFSPA